MDLSRRITTASLPFIYDPTIKLCNNKDVALHIYCQQLRKLNKNPEDMSDILNAEAMLQKLQFVEFVKNLSSQDQEMLKNSPMKHFILWRIGNQNSVSTPCRPVFDASQVTGTGFSLNDILAKGKNNMNNLIEIIIRWFSHSIAFHTDVTKMYNSVHLRKEDWTFQRYIWQKDLDPKILPEEKVIKTIIYGVKPIGNLAERGLRETALLSSNEYSEIIQVICNDVYVDDCLVEAVKRKHTI